jgi:hypothetical protein
MLIEMYFYVGEISYSLYKRYTKLSWEQESMIAHISMRNRREEMDKKFGKLKDAIANEIWTTAINSPDFLTEDVYTWNDLHRCFEPACKIGDGYLRWRFDLEKHEPMKRDDFIWDNDFFRYVERR